MIRESFISMEIDAGDIAGKLLAWYDAARRDLPWRAPPGETADPYHVWLSEMMLQQTTVAAVIPYYHEFLRRWPRVEALAAADLDEVLAAWAGLGYYARARNLHKAARIIAQERDGAFPDSADALASLPGIGPYTAAAIAAIAFDRPEAVVDGNVERVVARLFAVNEPLPRAKPELRKLAARLTPTKRPGDFAQAMMDLGATICSPRSPSCANCPIAGFCLANKHGITAQLPRRTPRAERPTRRGAAYVALRTDGCILLRRRPENGLLGGMMEPPTTDWTARRPSRSAALASVPVAGAWRRLTGTVGHTFTHFHLELDVYRCEVAADTALLPAAAPERCRWVARANLVDQALPSVMRKVLNHALAR